MKIYFDENLPKHLADGFQVLQQPEGLKTGRQIEIKYIPDTFGRGTLDEDWIPELGKINASVITRDLKIRSNKHEFELFKQHQLGLFFIRGKSKKQGLSVWEMVQMLAKHWENITEIVYEKTPPFMYEINYRKVKKLN